MSIETWKLSLEIIGITAVGVSVVTGAIALILGNSINKTQAAQSRKLDEDVTAAKIELGKQQVRAATAERDAADAKKSAGEADAKAESFRLDIAKANERAAEANKLAEQEHLARVRIEDKLAGWRLDAAAQARIINKIKQFKKIPFDIGVTPSELAFMETVDGMLLSAGWDRHIPKSEKSVATFLLNGKARINYLSGIHIEFATSRTQDFRLATEVLVQALRAEGIPVEGAIADNEPDASAIHILIGSK